MNIGQKINEFDNSDGSVKSFNLIFDYAPLKNSRGAKRVNGFVEIGKIAGLGKETVRNIKLYTQDMMGNMLIDEMQHDFGKNTEQLTVEKDVKKVPKSKRSSAKFNYTAKSPNGDILATSTTIKGLAEKVGIPKSVVAQRVHNNTKIKCKHDFTVEREER